MVNLFVDSSSDNVLRLVNAVGNICGKQRMNTWLLIDTYKQITQLNNLNSEESALLTTLFEYLIYDKFLERCLRWEMYTVLQDI